MRQAWDPETTELTLTAVMAALSDPIRVGLVRLLADDRERGSSELRAPVAKSTLSHYLRVLRDAGITRTRQEGTRCYVVLRRGGLEARSRLPGPAGRGPGRADRDAVGRRVTLTSGPAA